MESSTAISIFPHSTQAIVEIKIKRRHLFHTIFIISPTIILYIISGLTFLLPPDSGEKVSFAVTILLAQIVSFGTLGEIFPASSKNLPLLVYFVLTVTVHMSLVCLAATLGKIPVLELDLRKRKPYNSSGEGGSNIVNKYTTAEHLVKVEVKSNSSNS